jgi:CRP-like cAMP-binding protein
MPVSSLETALISPPNSFAVDGDPQIRNEILLGLPTKEVEMLFPKLEFVRLPVHHTLHERGDTLKSAYFVNSGLVSFLSVFPDGKSVEVGLVGKEGFVGLPLVAGFRTAPLRASVPVEASAFRIDASALIEILQHSPVVNHRLQQFSQVLAMEVAHLAACNRLHGVQQRMARWLLMSADRVDSKSLPLTQESLALMLGVRRSSVTMEATKLAEQGIISTSRGLLEIIDRKKLEEAACDCYGIIRAQLASWLDRSR